MAAKSPAQETASAAEFPNDAPHCVLVRECVRTMRHLMMNNLIIIYSVMSVIGGIKPLTSLQPLTSHIHLFDCNDKV